MNSGEAIEAAIRDGRQVLQSIILETLEDARTGRSAREEIRKEQERGRFQGDPAGAEPAPLSGRSNLPPAAR